MEFWGGCIPAESGDGKRGEALVYQAQDSNLLVNSEKIARLVGGYLASPHRTWFPGTLFHSLVRLAWRPFRRCCCLAAEVERPGFRPFVSAGV
jgi:hypothetical protein